MAVGFESGVNKTYAKTTSKIVTNQSAKSVAKPLKKSVLPGRFEAKAILTPSQFYSRGVVYQNGKKWTYFSGSSFADGSHNYGGYDKDGYLIVAAPSNYKFGQKVQTPLGMGKVHDRGTAIVGNHFDVVMP